MASALVTLKVSPHELDLIIGALMEDVQQNRELIDDPAVKAPDKHAARASVVETENLIRQLRG